MKQLIIDNLKLIIGSFRKVYYTFSIINSQFIAIAAILAITSCQRDPRYDVGGKMRLVIDVEQDIQHEGTVPLPEKMIVLFYDTKTGQLRETRFTGPTGGDFFINSGQYDMLVYNYDTESTIIRNNNDHTQIEAYTNEMPEVRGIFDRLQAALKAKGMYDTRNEHYGDAPIIYEPDHLFANRVQRVAIPFIEAQDDDIIVTVETAAKTILETYSIKIGKIEGIEYVRSAHIFLTGQVRSNYFGRPEKSDQPATIYFPIYIAQAREAADHFFTVFRTFGKLPGADNHVYLDVEITDTGGDTHEFEWDVTEQFDDPENDEHEIIIEVDNIVIPTPTGGGFNPTVNEWNPDEIKIPIE